MVRTSSVIFGVILALAGALGFVSNPLIGADALFAADTAHNVLHLVLGAVLLGVVYRFGEHTGHALRAVGALIFLLGLIGFLFVPSAGGSLFGLAHTNSGMNWFHLIAGFAVFIVLRYGDDRPRSSAL